MSNIYIYIYICIYIYINKNTQCSVSMQSLEVLWSHFGLTTIIQVQEMRMGRRPVPLAKSSRILAIWSFGVQAVSGEAILLTSDDISYSLE